MITPETNNYRAIEHLRDGRQIEIRALRPDDEADMLVAIGRNTVGQMGCAHIRIEIGWLLPGPPDRQVIAVRRPESPVRLGGLPDLVDQYRLWARDLGRNRPGKRKDEQQ